MTGFFDHCILKINGVPFPLPREVPELLAQGAFLVDLLEELETEIRAFGVERVIYLPHSEFERQWETLPLGQPLILADAVGLWSKHFLSFLREKGFHDVSSLAGGIADWDASRRIRLSGRSRAVNGCHGRAFRLRRTDAEY
ncbi:MAG TPA: rhodanese-like domain-containing protein [Bacteroidales bacterium]|nr:rhodanese-like domain-containing protein [Bacteroidales bacterium]